MTATPVPLLGWVGQHRVWLALIHLALVLAVYRDADRNGDHPAAVWTLVVLLTSVLGVVAYVALGRDPPR